MMAKSMKESESGAVRLMPGYEAERAGELNKSRGISFLVNKVLYNRL